MNSLRGALNKIPPGTTIHILRKTFSLPVSAARLILNDLAKPRSSHKPWIKKVAWNNEWSGCWIGEDVNRLDNEELYKRIQDADIVIFNLIGGGFRVGSCTMYMDTYIEWLKLLKYNFGMEAIIMSVDYRLAPEYNYPAPVEDVVRAYESLTRTLNVNPQKIVAVGDCSGASLILEMLFVTHDPSMFEIVTDKVDKSTEDIAPPLNELPRPAAVVLSSPIVTDETDSASWQANIEYDYVSQYTATVIKKDYFKSSNHDSSQDANQILGIAKLETGFRSFLPEQVLMYVGNKEVLRDDALDLAKKAKDDSVNWETVVEDCVHNWFMIPEVVKDKSVCQRAYTTFAHFCYRAVRHPRYQKSSENLSYISHYINSSLINTNSSLKKPAEGLERVLEVEEQSQQCIRNQSELDSNFLVPRIEKSD
ncbi:hypothetical protein G6F55_006060 [Rhizopus delemar]|nr:hypothetical protein G6F55_006060 [Rhizopus delemar]KAG1496065.1 hypothetical protein G6F54_006734 [Rhizopus delemar]KAG1521633.1 hypothetical protein G6F52_006566 [Rhizopus delemar]KAG1555691.1 hypothetical protein G6F49_006939 [Rhizopus delemar]KAG1583320.1 hypothetical protein G6F48_008590 [Rhizopus delemar]